MQKLFIRLVALVLCLAMFCAVAGCSRNYTSWNKIYFGSPQENQPDVTAESDQTPLDDSQFAAYFYVPDDWIYSRVDDYFFFASYEVTNLNQILRSNGELYLIGFVNSDDGVTYTNHDLSEVINLSIPVESTVFHMQLYNNASYGKETYIYFDKLVPKYYVSFQYDKYYTVKLIDWQGLCGKSLIKKIALSYQENLLFSREDVLSDTESDLQ